MVTILSIILAISTLVAYFWLYIKIMDRIRSSDLDREIREFNESNDDRMDP